MGLNPLWTPIEAPPTAGLAVAACGGAAPPADLASAGPGNVPWGCMGDPMGTD